jgi:uncharacterized protein YwgA
MAKLEEAMAYLCERYPYKSELSKARLTKMIYLADWRLALTNRRQVTSLKWVFNHYGPYLDDVKNEAQTNPRFELKRDRNLYGKVKELVTLAEHPSHFELDDQEKAALEHVVEKTKDLTWGRFIKLVYSTYPIATQPRYVPLDLESLADTYQRQGVSL